MEKGAASSAPTIYSSTPAWTQHGVIYLLTFCSFKGRYLVTNPTLFLAGQSLPWEDAGMFIIIVANILQHTQGDDWLLDQNWARLGHMLSWN